MSDPFIAQIVMFGGNFAPRQWALCEGQLQSIASNNALFSLVGTIYGGDGRTTFGLPELRGRTVLEAGNGPGLTSRREGQKGGSATNIMATANMPAHGHTATASVVVSDQLGTEASPSGNFLASDSQGDRVYFATGTASGLADGAYSATIANNGGQQSINNEPPYLAVNYIIALYGVFPSRS